MLATVALLLWAVDAGAVDEFGDPDLETEATDAGVAPLPPSSLSNLIGRVQSMGTREPIPAASLMVGTLELEAGDEGEFDVTVDAGVTKVHVAAAGYRPRDFTEALGGGQRLEVIYRLERNATPAYETTIRDQRARTEVARVALARPETHEVAGTMGEPMRAVMQLPGVSSVVSGLAYPVVRGTQPAATSYYLDGIRIPQLFHALAGPSVLHPDFIDHLDFFPGVPPARFGRLLGGAIEATSSRPGERFRVTGSIDLINASAFAEVPIARTGTTVSAAARVSYTSLLGAKIATELIPTAPGDPKTDVVANFYDYQARVEQKVGPGRLRLLAFGASDEVGTRPNGGDVPSGVFRSLFHRVDLQWVTPFAAGVFDVGVTVGRDVAGVSGEQGRSRTFDLTMGRWLGGARIGFGAEVLSGLTLRLGADVEVQSTTTDATGFSGTLLHNDVTSTHSTADGWLGGAYVQLRWVEGGFETLAGLRVDGYQRGSSLTLSSLEPRLEERVRVADAVAVRAAVGLFHQPPTLSLAFPVSDLVLLDQGLQYAAHSEVGLDISLPFQLEAGVTGFYDPLFRTVEHPITELLFPSGRAAGRPGTSYGLEVFLRRPATGAWFGWVSATLQRSERQVEVARFLPDGSVSERLFADVPGAFDQTLVLHAVVGVRFPRAISAGLGLHFNTGRPESGEISSRTQRGVRDPANGMNYWLPEDLDRVSRLPPFFRLDARVSKVWSFNDWELEAYLDVMNLSFSREVLAYDYTVQNNALVRSPLDVPVVLPMLGVKGRY